MPFRFNVEIGTLIGYSNLVLLLGDMKGDSKAISIMYRLVALKLLMNEVFKILYCFLYSTLP